MALRATKRAAAAAAAGARETTETESAPPRKRKPEPVHSPPSAAAAPPAAKDRGSAIAAKDAVGTAVSLPTAVAVSLAEPAQHLARRLQLAASPLERTVLLRALAQRAALPLAAEEIEACATTLGLLPEPATADETVAALPLALHLALQPSATAVLTAAAHARTAAALRHADHRVRMCGLRGLPLLARLGASPDAVAEAAATALGNAAAALQDRDPRVRAQALAALATALDVGRLAAASNRHGRQQPATSSASIDASDGALDPAKTGGEAATAASTVLTPKQAAPFAAAVTALKAWPQLVTLLGDANESVRRAAVAAVAAVAQAVPDALVSAADSARALSKPAAAAAAAATADDKAVAATARATDAAFGLICDMVTDLARSVRVAAFSALGDLPAVTPHLLLQTFDKKLMSHFQMRKSAHDKLKERHGTTRRRAPSAVTVTEDADAPVGDMDVHDVQLVATGACGAFVHGLEDEIAAVRSAAVRAIHTQAQQSPALALEALDFLVDMFNDEHDAVRTEAIATIAALAESYVMQEEQLDAMLGILEDASTAVRRGMQGLLARTRVKNHICLHVVVFSLLNNQVKYPADTRSIWGALCGLGRHHGTLAEYLCRRLLSTSPHFIDPEPDLNDATYVSVMVFLCNAADTNPPMRALVPGHFGAHQRFLHAALPQLVPAPDTGAAALAAEAKMETATALGMADTATSNGPATAVSAMSDDSSWRQRAAKYIERVCHLLDTAVRADGSGAATGSMRLDRLLREGGQWLQVAGKAPPSSDNAPAPCMGDYLGTVFDVAAAWNALLREQSPTRLASHLQRLLQATCRTKTLYFSPDPLFAVQLGLLDIMASLAFVTYASSCFESTVAEGAAAEWLVYVTNFAAELHRHVKETIGDPQKKRPRDGKAAPVATTTDAILDALAVLHKLLANGDWRKDPLDSTVAQAGYDALVKTGFGFLRHFPLAVYSRAQCLPSSLKRSAVPTKTSLSALAGLVLGLPVRMDLVADIPFETLRLEVILPDGTRSLFSLPPPQALPTLEVGGVRTARTLVTEGECKAVLGFWRGAADVTLRVVTVGPPNTLSAEFLKLVAQARSLSPHAALGVADTGNLLCGAEGGSSADSADVEELFLTRGDYGIVQPYVVLRTLAVYSVSMARATVLTLGQ